MKIRTEHVYPPIPLRQFDWSAVDDDRYDGLGSPIGWGATEEAAIADLMEQIEECEYEAQTKSNSTRASVATSPAQGQAESEDLFS